MAKLCRHHQIQFMSVLSYMRSEANPALEPSESSAHEGMAASSPAPVQQSTKNHEGPTGSRSALQSRPPFSREPQTPSQSNCKSRAEENWSAREEVLRLGTETSSAASVNKPAPKSCCGGTCIKNWTIGVGTSSIGLCAADCNKKGSVEPLQKETVSRKEIGDSQLDQSSCQCARISTVSQIEVVGPNSKESKAEGAVAAKAQNESLRAFPVELLNLSKNLAKNPSSSLSSSRPSLDHEAIKSTPIQVGPQENTNATKRTIKDNLVIPADVSTKDCWFVSKPHADTNGRLRLKAQSPSTKTARKSTRVSVLRARSSMSTVCQYVNEHDNQCDIVYISKPITECRFDAQRSLSSTKKTARKSTRGHLCNEEYWELQTVRTLARSSATDTKRANRPSLIPKPPTSASPKQALTLPVSVPAFEVPVAAGAGENGGSKVQLKVVLRRGQSEELKENQDFRCPAGDGELVVEPCQTRRSQEADAPSSDASSLPMELKKPGGQTNASGQSPEIKSAPILNMQTSGSIATRTDWRALGASSRLEPAVCESCDPSSSHSWEPLEECWQAPGSPSRLVQSVKEKDDTEHESSTEGSLNNSEPSPNNQIEALSAPSLNNLGTSPVNNIRVDIIPSQEQCNGSSEVLNGSEVMGDIPGSIVGNWRAGGFFESFENTKELREERPLTGKEKSNRSGQTLSFPTVVEAIACTLTPKKEPCPQIASGCKEERSSNDPGGPALGLKGPCERTDGIKCKMPLADPYLEERSLDDLGKNVAANKREGGNSTGRSPNSEKNTSPQKEKALTPATSEKVKHRKKLELASSDRCLRSQQSQPQPTASPCGVKQEPLVCAEGLLVPCLNVKLLRSQSERGYKREVCVNRVASVQFPMDCFNKILLQSIIDPESRVDESLATTSVKDTGKTRKLTAKQVSKGLLAESSADEEPMDDSFVYERAYCGQGRMLEVYVDTRSSEERKVSFSSEKVDTDQGTESSDDSADDPSPATHQQSSLGKVGVHKESQKWARGGLAKRSASFGPPHPANKGMAAKMSPGDKKAIGSRDMRFPNVSITEPEMVALEADNEGLNINLSTEVLQEPEDSELIDLNDSDAPEVSRPKFLDWCSEDENQELITTLNAKYENIHKAWIQIEKEGSVMQKAKSKSDWLKEIWKSKKRARKARGLYDHKTSPVQKLFVANFDFANICKWFMETTETRSLVIVKNVTARNPVETLKAKSFLQKSSAVGLFPSPQAERLRKHLKKFAVASPARNNWRTRALMDSVQRGGATRGDGANQRQDFLPDVGGGLVPRNLFLPQARGSLAEGDGPLGSVKAAQPSKHLGMKKPLSAWILRKYSNMREKLRVQQQSQHGKEQAARKHPAKHRSVCMNPLVSPKLTSQTQLDTRGVPPPSASPKPKENKGKRKPPRDAPAKELRAGRSKSSKSEAVPVALPSSKSTSRQLPANRKPRAEGSAAKPPGPKKPARGSKADTLLSSLSRKGVEKRFSGSPLKTVQKGKSRSQNRDGVKGRKVKPKTKAGSGKERQAKTTKRTRPSPVVAAQARAKRREKTGVQRKSKAVAPTKSPAKAVAPTKSPAKAVAPTKTPIKAVAPTKTPVKAVAPTKTPVKAVAPTKTPVKAVAPVKGVCKTEAVHKKKRKLNEKSQLVPNKRRRTDAK
ncbi:uncharacterized protein [Heptranchias perlo]|uniref:uncharacterized protein n=1 Tax=Heptranchias perlo TaxID=212740 RepID=UPI00355A478F